MEVEEEEEGGALVVGRRGGCLRGPRGKSRLSTLGFWVGLLGALERRGCRVGTCTS